VEVCGVGGKVTPFEAESADVSGRGIRLRTAYLPDPGEPVVCRFENSGQEVIAEGIVAWCQKATRGGEFGVRFTALDARSAESLKVFCGLGPELTVDAPTTPELGEREPRRVATGSKVKLHIEGLGAPMRARVDEGHGARIAVGSTLEFLRIGRKLEMESVEDGSRREARIDGLDVTIDPTTGVPRLLVLLKTEGDETTPAPSVVDARRSERSDKSATTATTAPRTNQAAVATKSEKPEPPTQEDIEAQVEIMVGRMRRIAGRARRKVTEVSGHLGERFAPTMDRAFQSVRQLSRRTPEPARRKTAPPPTATPTGAERKLRPQNRTSQSEVVITSRFLQPKYKRAAGAVAALGLLATVIAVAARSPEPVRSTANDSTVLSTPVLAAQPLTNAPAPGGSAVAGVTQNNGSIVAQVPLFGSTPLATLEPAPLPASGSESPDVVSARELALAKATHAAVAPGADPSLTSSEEPTETLAEEPSAKPEDVAPWGKGKMKDPILYRIKLDEAGNAIKGTTQSKGFSVIIPGRKAMESPKGFVGKDPRFSKISAQNTSEGVKVTWLFKDEVPAYRVRLRKTSVEVLISEAVKSGKAD
jgi:hypothetical protein